MPHTMFWPLVSPKRGFSLKGVKGNVRRTEAEKAKFYRKEEDEVKVRLTLCILSSTLSCPPFCIRLHTHALARLTESFARNIFLQRMLFALFAKHEYYTIDNLYQQTEQPKVSLNPPRLSGPLPQVASPCPLMVASVCSCALEPSPQPPAAFAESYLICV